MKHPPVQKSKSEMLEKPDSTYQIHDIDFDEYLNVWSMYVNTEYRPLQILSKSEVLEN